MYGLRPSWFNIEVLNYPLSSYDHWRSAGETVREVAIRIVDGRCVTPRVGIIEKVADTIVALLC